MVDKSLKKRIIDIIPYNVANRLRLLKNKHNSSLSLERIKKITDHSYFLKNGKHINWEKPVLYTEKINYSKIFCADDVKTKLTDKIAVRDWVKEKIGEEYLIPIYGIYDAFTDIKWSKLPNSFVIKCNHDSGSVKVVSNKHSLAKAEIKKLEDLYDGYYLKRNFGYKTFEMQYVNIKPRIIIEKCLGDNVSDYKFLCFGGVPYYCWVDIDRFSDHHKRNIYDLEWKLQPFNQMTYGNYEGKVDKPDEFETMVDIAQKLSAGFDHVRVDLYNCNGKVYFGEMTFTNGSGFEVITPSEWDKRLGDLWNLDIR